MRSEIRDLRHSLYGLTAEIENCSRSRRQELGQKITFFGLTVGVVSGLELLANIVYNADSFLGKTFQIVTIAAGILGAVVGYEAYQIGKNIHGYTPPGPESGRSIKSTISGMLQKAKLASQTQVLDPRKLRLLQFTQNTLISRQIVDFLIH